MSIPACAAAALSLVLVFASASAIAGTFTSIVIDGDFSDWSGVPVLDSDPLDNAGSIDIASIQIANDTDFLYLRVSFHQPITVNPNLDGSVFIAIDNDSNASTGFDIFTLGLIGSEVGWQNDFAFEQSLTAFNAGVVNDGAAVVSPLFNFAADASVTTSEREYALPRAGTFAGSGNPIFPSSDVDVLVYTDAGIQDVSSVLDYSFAVPEPSTASLVVVGLLGLAASSRRSLRR